jgi:hypothetical protein
MSSSKKHRSDHTTAAHHPVLSNASLLTCVGDFLSLRDVTRFGEGCQLWRAVIFGTNYRRLRMKREFHASLMEPDHSMAHTLTTHGPAMWLDPKKPLPRVLRMPLSVASALLAYITKNQARPTCLLVHDPALCTPFFDHYTNVPNAASGRRPFVFALVSHVQSPVLRNTALAFWCESDREEEDGYHPLRSDERHAYHPWLVLEADETSDQAQFGEDGDLADEYDDELTDLLVEYGSRIPGHVVEAFIHKNNTELVGQEGSESNWTGEVLERDDAMVAVGGICAHLKATLMDIFPQRRPVLPTIDAEVSMHVVPDAKHNGSGDEQEEQVATIPRGTLDNQAMDEVVIVQWHTAIASGVLDTEDKRREFVQQFYDGDKNDNIWKIMMAHYGAFPDPAHAFGIPECLV